MIIQAMPTSAQTKESLNDELFAAATLGDVRAANDLLRRGADIEYVKPGFEQTVLQAAIFGMGGDKLQSAAHLQVVKLLLDRGAKLEGHEGAKGTALFTAVRLNGITPQTEDQIKVVKMLLDHGASTGMLPEIQATPLHGAAECMHLESARLLIAHHADVNAIDSYGATPLQVVKESPLVPPEDKRPMIDLLKGAGGK
jgi:ankyrin repeat protein